METVERRAGAIVATEFSCSDQHGCGTLQPNERAILWVAHPLDLINHKGRVAFPGKTSQNLSI
eukprot:5884083-Amphidinium_carterae.1